MLGFMTIAVFVSFVVARRLGVDAAADEALLATWRTGMTALAALPNVHVKLSMFSFVRSVSLLACARCFQRAAPP